MTIQQRLKTMTSEEMCSIMCESIVNPIIEDDQELSFILGISEEPCYDKQLLEYLELVRRWIWKCVDTSEYPGGMYKDYYTNAILKTMAHFKYITFWDFTEEEYILIYNALNL